MYTAIKLTVAAAAIACSIGVAKADDECAVLAQYGIDCQSIMQSIQQSSSDSTSSNSASNSASVSQ